MLRSRRRHPANSGILVKDDSTVKSDMVPLTVAMDSIRLWSDPEEMEEGAEDQDDVEKGDKVGPSGQCARGG